MKILITGAKGFVGKNLCYALNNIKDGKDRTRPNLKIDEVYAYDIDSTPAELDEWCQKADFVFNLAGVNRPKETSEFMEGNFGFASTLLDMLKKHGNRCPVMLSSSQQASLTGRFGNSEYGRSKKAGEDLFLEYERGVLRNEDIADCADRADYADGADCADRADNAGLRPRVLIYRFPNLFGKWCRPNYNSAVATFCHAIANDLPYTVNDPSVELELLYIDDLMREMLDALEGKEHRCEFEGLTVIPSDPNSFTTTRPSLPKEGTYPQPNRPPTSGEDLTAPPVAQNAKVSSDHQRSGLGSLSIGRYCYCPVTHRVTLGEIVELLKSFAEQPKTLIIPEIPAGSFAKKLYSTYLSYLPKEKMVFQPKNNEDYRGNFIEIIKTKSCGQFSVNVSKPGITRGQHWHHSKWEIFAVVSGHGLIQERQEGTEEVISFEVSGDDVKAIQMLPGYTHNIINLSDTEPLVTFMWANELFDPNFPDTYFDPVE